MAIDPLTFLFEVVNFLVLLWLLKRFLYRPVLSGIAQRQAQQNRVQEEVAAQMQQAEILRQQYEVRLHEWTEQKVTEQARLQHELAVERERQLLLVRQAAEDEQARIDARRENERLMQLQLLDKQARQDALSFATRLLQRFAAAELNLLLVDMFLENVQQMSPEQIERLRNAGQRADAVFKITSSHALPEDAARHIQNALEAVLQHPVQAQFAVDALLLCGLRIEVGTCILEANFAGELSWFADLLEREHG